MTSPSRIVRSAILIAAFLLLLPAAASAASHAGHIDLQDGLTLAQQFGYAPDYRQHVVTFDAGNVPSIRSRGASEDDTSFVQRLEDGAWVRHDLLDALRDAYPDFAGTVHAGGYGTDRVDWDVDGRAYTVLTIRLDDDGGFRNVLMASLDGCQTWQVLELPFGDDTPQTDPHDWGNVIAEHDGGRACSRARPSSPSGGSSGPGRASGRRRTSCRSSSRTGAAARSCCRPPVTVSSLALTLLQCSGGASFAVDPRRHELLRVQHRRAARHRLHADLRGHLRRGHEHRRREHARRAVAARPTTSTARRASCIDSAGVLHVVTGAHGRPFKYARSSAPLSTAGWTKPINVLDSGYRARTTDADGLGKQTYLSLVCGPDDVLHIAFRQGRRNVDSHFRGYGYDALVHQSLAPGQTKWSRADLIVVPPLRRVLAVLPEADRRPARAPLRLVQLLLEA